MRFSRSSTISVLFLVGALCWSAQAHRSWAASPADEVRLDAIGSPFSSMVIEGQWNIRYPRISNRSDKPRTVRVVYSTSSPNYGNMYFSRVLTLPPRSAQWTEMAVLPYQLEESKIKVAKREMGNEMYQLIDDATGQNLAYFPVSLAKIPRHANDRGQWQPGTQYDPNDLVMEPQPPIVPGAAAPVAGGVEASGSRSRYWLCIKPHRSGAAFIGAGQGSPDPEYWASSEGGGLVLASAASQDEYNDFSYLGTLPQDVLGSGVTTISAPTDLLPDRWYGYSMVQVMIVGGMEMRDIRPSQWTAMLDWVRRGGVLVLTGSTNMEDMLQGELAQAAGVTCAGVHSVQSLDVPAMNLKGPVVLNRPLPMAQLCVEDAKVLYEANGMPLITQHQLGNGMVFTLAVPAGALKNMPLGGLWTHMASPRARPVPVVHNDDRFYLGRCVIDRSPVHGSQHSNTYSGRKVRLCSAACAAKWDQKAPSEQKQALQQAGQWDRPKEDGTEVLNQIAGQRAPLPRVPVGILVGLAGAFVVAGIVMRLKRRGELVWVVLVPVAMLIGVGMYIYGRSQTKTEKLSYIGLVTNVGNDKAAVQEVFAYYSGPAGQKVTFASGDAKSYIDNTRVAGVGAFAAGNIETGAQMTLPDQEIPVNSIRPFRCDAVLDLRPLSGSITFGPDGAVCELANHLPAPLNDAVVYVNQRAYSLGTVGADKSATWTVGDNKNRLPLGEFSSKATKGDEERYRGALLEQMIDPGLRELSSEPLILGYSSFTPLEPMPGRQVEKQGWSLVAWPLRYQAPKPGTRVVIPSGFCQWSFLSPRLLTLNNLFETRYAPSEILLAVKPPDIVGRFSPQEAAAAKLHIAIHATGYKLNIYGVRNYDAKVFAARGFAKADHFKLIRSIDNPLVDNDIPVNGIDEFYNEKYGYVFAVAVAPPGEQSPVGPLPAGSGAHRGPAAPIGGQETPPWNIDALEITLEGSKQ